jgi:hypothetical protein
VLAKKGYTTVIHKLMNDLSPILAKSVDTAEMDKNDTLFSKALL